MRLSAGDDWAEDHHDAELVDAAGRVLARRRLPEGVAGMARPHELTGQHLGEDDQDAEVVIGIETGRGPRVAAPVAAGYTVYAVHPRQASRYRERHGAPGAKSDRGDSHMLAGMVRTGSHQLRAVAGDGADAAAVQVVARTRKTPTGERTGQARRPRCQLREDFPAALAAFEDLDAPGAPELPAKAPDPARARRLTRAQVSAALKRARRRDIPGQATAILAAPRSAQLGQPPAPTAARAAAARSLIAVITVLDEQAKALQGPGGGGFWPPPGR
jgi:Transposase